MIKKTSEIIFLRSFFYAFFCNFMAELKVLPTMLSKMRLKIKRKNIIWILIYAVLIILGTQFLISYLYKDINQKAENFISDKIENQKIVDFDTLSYTLGKGTYVDMILQNKKSYPIFVENEFEETKKIKLNSILNKNSSSKIFTIKNAENENDFTILTVKSQENFMRILLFCISLLVIFGTFYNYGIERNNKT